MVKTSDMWSKIYLGVLAVSVILISFFTYYSWSWLQSIGLPMAAVAGYEYHAGLALPMLWISTIALLILGSAVLWTSGRAWAMWVTFLYFALFVMLRYFWLDQAFFQFKKTNGIADSTLSMAPILAVVLVVLMAIIVFFNTFLVVRLRAKTYPATAHSDTGLDSEEVVLKRKTPGSN